MFKKAERKQAKLRLALSGPSGSGKTYGALLIAKGLGGKIAVLDTERGSASLYADLVDFDVVELGPPYKPERYIEVIQEAEKAGYNTLILDSITHEWNGEGGVLQIVDNYANAKCKGNTYAAWNEGTPRHQRFIDSMLASKMHIIATMRSKTAYVETVNSKGKLAPQKMGTAPQQRDGLEYEFTCVLDLTVDRNLATASKDRTRLFQDSFVITDKTGHDLAEWLDTGKSFEDQEKDRREDTRAMAKSANDNPGSDAQRKALFAIMGKKHGNNRKAILAELSEFFGREIASSNELTRDDISDFLDAVQSGGEAA